MTQNKDALKISLIAILCGILLGVVILVLSGENPIALRQASDQSNPGRRRAAHLRRDGSHSLGADGLFLYSGSCH